MERMERGPRSPHPPSSRILHSLASSILSYPLASSRILHPASSILSHPLASSCILSHPLASSILHPPSSILAFSSPRCLTPCHDSHTTDDDRHPTAALLAGRGTRPATGWRGGTMSSVAYRKPPCITKDTPTNKASSGPSGCDRATSDERAPTVYARARRLGLN